MKKRVRIVVSGTVQGVGYRWHCRREASARGIGGFVRNLPDGRVEAVLEGDAAAVDAMVDWCRSGPRSASVSSAVTADEQPLGESSFRISA